MTKVFVVGNVSAEEATKVDSFTFGDVSVKASDDANDYGTVSKSSSNNNAEVTFAFDATKLNMIDKGDRPAEAAWIGVEIAEPTATLSSSGNATITAKSGLTGKDKATLSKVNTKYYEYFGVRLEDLQKAIVSDGKIVFNYEIEWAVKEDDKVLETYTQKINVIVDASKVTLTDTREDSDTENEALWNADKAKLYKIENPATETEGNETTDENKKDDVPKTGEVILMA